MNPYDCINTIGHFSKTLNLFFKFSDTTTRSSSYYTKTAGWHDTTKYPDHYQGNNPSSLARNARFVHVTLVLV